MPRLFIYPKNGAPLIYDFRDKQVSIGRLPDNDIIIDDAYISGHHALILPAGESRYFIKDNLSKNGTLINGLKITEETLLLRGDEIGIGSTKIFFDKESTTSVEMIDEKLPENSVQSVIRLNKILPPTDTATIKKELAGSVEMEKLKLDYRYFPVLTQVSQALILHKPIDELLDEIMDLICKTLPMDRAILMLKEGNPPDLVPKEVRIADPNLITQKIQVSRCIIDIVLAENSSVLTYDAQIDPRFRASESIVQSNIHSAMCVPLWNNRAIIGVIYADRILHLERFSEEDLKLLTLLSNLAAIKIENARLIQQAIEKEKMERELALASQIQKDFLPRQNPKCDKFDMAGYNLTCYQVGGDYYDFINIDDHRMAIVVADVSGKGVSASLLMASLRAAIYAELSPEYSLERLGRRLNDFVHHSSSASNFITFFLLELDRETGEIKYLNAGHNPPLILTKDGQVKRLESCGFCLGMFPSVKYEVSSDRLEVGDLAVLYTDGITESRNQDKEEFGEERLIEAVRKNSKLPAQKMLEMILGEVNKFSQGIEPDDDRTLVIVKRTAGPS
ncbi:MAG: SpoIIE family protein phosphatase [Candidatus Saccharicenans sp.]